MKQATPYPLGIVEMLPGHNLLFQNHYSKLLGQI